MTDHDRVMAVCEHCGSAYAAKVLQDGNVRPIGQDACSCGSEEFQILE
ncbi:hypothetical protein ACYJ1Y_08885 [Natrialbaceae archaeon A-gly3]